MSDGWVKSVNEKRDLRVLMFKDFKFSKQCLLAKNKAKIMVGIIKREILYKYEVISKLYTLYVKPDLEYCIKFWSLM